MTSPTYDGQALFASGPTHCEVGGAALAFAEHQPLHGQGSGLFSQGRQGRAITQTGTLIADTVDALQQQINAIEAYVDGTARELVDERDRPWPNMVMLAFEPSVMRRLGVRWQVSYRVQYRQVRP
ncbi:MAG: hypothetical protein WD534_04835 [Phycisphaeraceae bacterium]